MFSPPQMLDNDLSNDNLGFMNIAAPPDHNLSNQEDNRSDLEESKDY